MFNKWSQNWKITTRHLQAARDLLPFPLVEYSTSDCGSLKGFKESLACNELEMALDELEGLGEANACSVEFWRELLLAAENMELTVRTNYYRDKIDEA